MREGREEEFFDDIREFEHVKEMLEFFRIFSGDKRYEEIKKPIMEKAEKGEGISMCTLMDMAINRGMSRGLIEGVIEGEVKAYCGLIDEGVLTIEYAAEKMGLSIADFLGEKEEMGLACGQ